MALDVAVSERSASSGCTRSAASVCNADAVPARAGLTAVMRGDLVGAAGIGNLEGHCVRCGVEARNRGHVPVDVTTIVVVNSIEVTTGSSANQPFRVEAEAPRVWPVELTASGELRRRASVLCAR